MYVQQWRRGLRTPSFENLGQEGVAAERIPRLYLAQYCDEGGGKGEQVKGGEDGGGLQGGVEEGREAEEDQRHSCCEVGIFHSTLAQLNKAQQKLSKETELPFELQQKFHKENI